MTTYYNPATDDYDYSKPLQCTCGAWIKTRQDGDWYCPECSPELADTSDDRSNGLCFCPECEEHCILCHDYGCPVCDPYDDRYDEIPTNVCRGCGSETFNEHLCDSCEELVEREED